MFATISRSGRILRSVFFAGGRRSMTISITSQEIVRLVVAINDRSYDQSWPPTIDRTINRGILREQSIGGATGRKVARLVAQQIVRPLTIWNSRFQVLNMSIDLLRLICPLRSPTTYGTNRTTSATSRTFFLRFAHDCNILRSQVGRNLVVSPV